MSMKLNKLASAVSVSLAALALAACGGSSGSGSSVTTPSTQIKVDSLEETIKKQLEEQKKKLEEEQAKKLKEIEDKLKEEQRQREELQAKLKGLDEKTKQNILNQATDALVGAVVTLNPTIGHFNATEDTSYGGFHYTNRADVSSYDRLANPENKNQGSNRIPLGVTLDGENPHLTNFVIGTEMVKASDGKEYRALNYVGESHNGTTKVDVDGVTVSYRTKNQNGAPQNRNFTNQRDIIQAFNKNDPAVGVTGGLAVKSGVTLATNQALGTITNATNRNQYVNDLNKSGLLVQNTTGVVIGLLEENTSESARTQSDTQHRGGARIFGKNYAGVNYKQSNLPEHQKEQLNANSYVAAANAKGELSSVSQLTLNNVQYGRLSTNIDTLDTLDSSSLNDAKQGLKIYRKLAQRGYDEKVNQGVVDVYFARGTNGTTKEQMDALKVKGGILNYEGHALTYGIGVTPASSQTGSKFIPNSFGKFVRGETIGNFVNAKYDTAKDTVKGSIYNFIDPDTNDVTKPYVKQDLVKFEGAVSLNNVIGVATNLTEADKNKAQGTLFASFFGPEATELGGTITSIVHDKDKFYGEGKWGAAFGAHKTGISQSVVTGEVSLGATTPAATTTPAKP